ncbi:hypothetical protein G9A89_008371 [Geosiphon pyriformis]|nr:hypothetical protein G9A89_008371 [Geosiphon pyriformis]
MNETRLLELRWAAKEMFYHGFDNYMKYAFPKDELNPIQCDGRGSDKKNPNNIEINDVLGDYSLTLVDSLDTFVVLRDKEKFEKAVRQVIDYVSFNVDSKVQVFESNIRGLGGLLSAHLFATDSRFGFTIDWYKNELLELALDLGERLLIAFQNSKTGLPFPRVNLKYGIPRSETHETCTAGAGTLILEFGVLSRLTNDSRFENAARGSLFGLWNRRTDLDLVGNVIDIQTGHWIHTASSTGAGIDSFFEYLLKAYVLFGESEYLEVFKQAYSAILRHIRDESGYLYRNVNIFNGGIMSFWVDSLSAYFPGLQVLAGDLESAIKSHFLYYNIWRKYHALPERFNYQLKNVEIGSYPLRPEFIESTYFLYRATRDPFYLQVGEMVLQDLEKYTRVKCGYASIRNVLTKAVDERMESFALSETFKYLYLLFDTNNPFNKLDDNFVFTTEAHIFPLSHEYLKPPSVSRRKSQVIDNSVCQVYEPRKNLVNSVSARPDADFAKELVGYEEYTIPLVEVRIDQIGRSERLPSNQGISPGQILEIRDPAVKEFWIKQQTYNLIILRVHGTCKDDYKEYLAAAATFGPKVMKELPISKLAQIISSPFGCNDFSAAEQEIIHDQIIMLKRGGCTFVEKVIHAQKAGVRAVIIVSDENYLFQPAPPSENDAAMVQIPCALITQESGMELERRLSLITIEETQRGQLNSNGSYRTHIVPAIHASLLPERVEVPTLIINEGEKDVRLTINGHVIHNIRLNVEGNESQI